jgi:hypothetical protein
VFNVCCFHFDGSDNIPKAKYNHTPANVNYQIPMLFMLSEGPLPYPLNSATLFNTESAEANRTSYKKQNKLYKNLVHNRAEFSTAIRFVIDGLSLPLSIPLSLSPSLSLPLYLSLF